MGIIEEVIPEPLGGAHRDHREAASNLKSFLIRSIREIEEKPRAELLDRRYDRFRKIGVFEEGSMGIEAEVGVSPS
jgi:acetyl-CoA carboxylase carboxyl transferase subunit alpha